jgi:hypothetical protein
MVKRYACLVVMILALIGHFFAASAADSGPNDAVVTAIQGSARVYNKGVAAGRTLKKGDRIKKEQEIKVAEKSRIELRFADGTVMRLSERSHLRMSELSFNKKRKTRTSARSFCGKLK